MTTQETINSLIEEVKEHRTRYNRIAKLFGVNGEEDDSYEQVKEKVRDLISRASEYDDLVEINSQLTTLIAKQQNEIRRRTEEMGSRDGHSATGDSPSQQLSKEPPAETNSPAEENSPAATAEGPGDNTSKGAYILGVLAQ